MSESDELRAFAALLRNDLAGPGLEAERLHELTLLGVLAELEEWVLTLSAETEPAAAVLPSAVEAAVLPSAVEAADELPAQTPPLDPTQLLYEAAARHASGAVRRQAARALLRLAELERPAAIQAVYWLAIEQDLLAARQAVETHNDQPAWQQVDARLRALFDWFSLLDGPQPYPDDRLAVLTRAYFEIAPPEVQRRLLAGAGRNRAENWARIVTAIADGSASALEGLVEDYPNFRPAERRLALAELARLAVLAPPVEAARNEAARKEAAREAVAALFVRHEAQEARALALSRGYLPADAEQRALFLFLAEAWEEYAALDSDASLLTQAYEAAGRSLRRRLIEHSRHSGQMEWLRSAGMAGETRWLADLSDTDWELVIRRLGEADKHPELWVLAQAAPPLWSAAILERLAQAGWQPQEAAEQAGFETLTRLARECLASPLEIRPKKGLRSPAEDISGLALHPNGRELAAGSAGQAIYRWALPDGDPRPALTGPSPLTRVLAYSPDGDYLAGASGDHRIRVYRLGSGQVLKMLEGHRAMIRGLAISPDGRLLCSAGFDGSLRLWRFPGGPELSVARAGSGEIFGIAMNDGGRNLVSGGADGLVRVWKLPEGGATSASLAREIKAHEGIITHLAASLNSELVASAGRDGRIALWNANTGGLVRAFNDEGGSPLTNLCLHPNEQVLIGGRNNGQISLWNLATGRVLATSAAHPQAVTGLALSPQGDMLYSASAGSPVQVWDLRTFLLIRLPGEGNQPVGLEELQARLQQPNLPAAEKKWLSLTLELARWRQRFDIELAEFETITVGEFDIELA